MPQKTKALTLILLLTFVAAVSVRAEDGGNHHSHDRHGTKTLDIRNFHEVHPWLFRGGDPPDEAFKTLSDKGIKTVIDLRDRKRSAEKEKSICNSLGMRYIQIPMSHRSQPTKEQISQFLKIVSNAREHKNEGPVFVHCELGDDRTGCMIGISRIAFDNYTFEDAYKEMLRLGFSRHFESLKLAVQQYAEQKAQ